MAFELGSTITIKQDKHESAYIINGEFTKEKLQQVLDRFIEKYVCCSKCKLPEMVIKIEEGKIKGACKGCGHHALLDNKHRMASYITKGAGAEKPKKKDKGKDKDVDREVSNQKKAGKKRVKKVRIFSDPEVKAFKAPLAEKNYPLDPKDETVKQLLVKYQAVFLKNRSAEGAKKKVNLEKAYRNLKVLKVPAEKQSLYGFLYFGSVFTLNIANQIEKEASTLRTFYEVGSPDAAQPPQQADAARGHHPAGLPPA